MESKTVSLVKCADYQRANVDQAVRQAIDLIGGIGAFVSPGQKVLVKFNLLLGSPPETCVTTNPEVVYAVAKLLRDHGCSVILGDSPGSGLPYTEAVLRKAYAAAGYDKVAVELGVTLNYDVGYKEVPAPGSRTIKRFPIINPALDCDAIVVVSKAKTHASTFFSGATKNLFGVIPGLEKPSYHARLPDPKDFGRMIVDLNDLMKPKLQIMDAIMGMEGDGPHSGAPCRIGALLASGDGNAIDVATCRLVSIDPIRVPTIAAAVERGYLHQDLSDVVVVGAALDELVVKNFKAPSTYLARTKDGFGYKRTPRWIMKLAYWFLGQTAPSPVIHLAKCIACMRCVRSCPTKTISVVGGKPKISYSKCIRCYCCHEMCDSHAISLERSLVGRILTWLASKIMR